MTDTLTVAIEQLAPVWLHKKVTLTLTDYKTTVFQHMPRTFPLYDSVRSDLHNWRDVAEGAVLVPI